MKRTSDEVVSHAVIDTRSFAARTDESKRGEQAQMLRSGRRGKAKQFGNLTGSPFGETIGLPLWRSQEFEDVAPTAVAYNREETVNALIDFWRTMRKWLAPITSISG